MKRIAMLLSAATLVTSMAVLAPTPVSAADACAGTGTATVPGGLNYPVTTTSQPAPTNLSSFSFNFNQGRCVTKTSLSAAGTVHGHCGNSTGAGVTNNGRSFTWVGVGGTLVLSGGLTGVVNAAPDPTIAGNTCSVNFGALFFLVNGSVVLTP